MRSVWICGHLGHYQLFIDVIAASTQPNLQFSLIKKFTIVWKKCYPPFERCQRRARQRRVRDPEPRHASTDLEIKIKEHFAKRGIIAVTKSEDDRPLVFVDNLHDKTWWRVLLNDGPFEKLVTPWSRTRRWSGRWWWRWSRQTQWLPENYLLKFWCDADFKAVWCCCVFAKPLTFAILLSSSPWVGWPPRTITVPSGERWPGIVAFPSNVTMWVSHQN